MKLSNSKEEKPLHFSKIEKKTFYATKENIVNFNKNVNLIQDLIEYALNQAIKYKFDPVASQIHEQYLQIAKDIKSHIAK